MSNSSINQKECSSDKSNSNSSIHRNKTNLSDISEKQELNSDDDDDLILNDKQNLLRADIVTSEVIARSALEEDPSAACNNADASGVSDLDHSSNDKDDDKDSKKKKNRCAVCRKKVGLTGFECRCGGLFCGVHRYSDKHNCTFDYREMGAQEIRRNNPVVVGEKIQKI